VKIVVLGAAVVTAIGAAVACGGGGQPPPKTSATAPGGSHDFSKWPKDDKSLCQVAIGWRDHPELEVQETVGPGSIKPNVRRIYRWVGERENRKQLLVCREIDTNLDGIKDVIRTFDEHKGEAKHEEADTDYDGVIDVKVDFVAGRIAREEIDTRHKSTVQMWVPDVWKFYIDGILSRIRRNTHCPSGKADTWEIYRSGRLERVGNDQTCDGHVDRWDRDTDQVIAQDEAQKAAEAEGGAPQAASIGLPSADGGADAGKRRK
jgi:hypothetical protein